MKSYSHVVVVIVVTMLNIVVGIVVVQLKAHLEPVSTQLVLAPLLLLEFSDDENLAWVRVPASVFVGESIVLIAVRARTLWPVVVPLVRLVVVVFLVAVLTSQLPLSR